MSNSAIFAEYALALFRRYDYNLDIAAELGWYDWYSTPLHLVGKLNRTEMPPGVYSDVLALRTRFIDHLYALASITMGLYTATSRIIPCHSVNTAWGVMLQCYMSPYDDALGRVAQLAWRYSLRGDWHYISAFINETPWGWHTQMRATLQSGIVPHWLLELDTDLRATFPNALVWKLR